MIVLQLTSHPLVEAVLLDAVLLLLLVAGLLTVAASAAYLVWRRWR